MPSRAETGPYHNRVASDVRTILGERVAFHASEDEWYKVRDGSELEFELVPVDPLRSRTAMRLRREDSTTHRVSVFPLSASPSSRLGTFWVSWHETWLKRNSTSYVLLNAGWTLFEGLEHDRDKKQVLRLDWDQLPHRGSPRAGHPHWHFDHELFVSAEPDKVEVQPGLVQVRTEGPLVMARPVSVGSIHLAMGAWNEHEDHPRCWQRDYREDCQQLRDWCRKTLTYLKEQVGSS
jgi:hypothetical protein